jgi:hypothetical protein
MVLLNKRILFGLCLFSLVSLRASGQASAPTAATTYLQHTSDRYQQSIDVYTTADAAGNHFAARGAFASLGGLGLLPAMDEISSNAPCLGITCITASINFAGSNFGGWYFMNGLLGPTDRLAQPNWGTQPNAGYDLTGAAALRFRARGVNGGEKVEFFVFGVGYDPDTGLQTEPFPDSSKKISLNPNPVTLSTTWTPYEIPLAGVDIHYVLGGFGWAASAQNQANSLQPIAFYLDDIQYVKSRPADPRFLVSYETIKSNNAFDVVERNAGFVYDNAVTLIALIAAGDLDRARTIADALVFAQSNDRFFTDGRLRNAYQGGDLMQPPGWIPNSKSGTVRMPGWYDPVRTTWFEDEAHVSTYTGNVGWAMLALLNFYEVTREQKYLQAVDQLGNWVIANASDNRGAGGFTAGYDGWENRATSGGALTCPSAVFVNGQCKRLYKSTEHNIELHTAFSRLYTAERLDQWNQAAQSAKAFLLSMWDPAEGKFWTGTDESGIKVFKDVIPVDIQAWAIQALGADAQPFLGALDYVEAHHKTALGYGFKQNGGNQCGDNTWFEGTSQVALAHLLVGNRAKWQSILNTLHSAELASGAMPATDGTCLNTGFVLNDGQSWDYFPRAHVGATAWLSLTENGINPFTSTLPPPPDFTISPTATSLTVSRGGQSSVTLTFAAQGGFSGNISVSCSVAGPSPLPTCGFSPASFPLAANSTTSTLTVSATNTSGNLVRPLDRSRPFQVPAARLLLLALGLLGIGLGIPKSREQRLALRLLCCLVVGFALQQVGCGTVGPPPPTAPQVYSVRVTAASGSTQHFASVAVTVQ